MMGIISSLFERRELLYYLIIGTIATAIDWSVYAAAVNWLGFHYQLALITGYLGGSTAHYIANKLITFKCQSKAIGSQLSLYALVQGASLGASMVVMGALVRLFPINSVILRMATTIIMILPNYLLHKHLSFNKKIFV
jgi:putative flippase GtrA